MVRLAQYMPQNAINGEFTLQMKKCQACLSYETKVSLRQYSTTYKMNGA